VENHNHLTKPRSIENYLDKIQLKSKGTIRNVKNYLKRFDTYLQTKYQISNEAILNEILDLPQKQQDRTLFDVLQDFVNDLSAKQNFYKGTNISSGYVRHTVYALKGYLRYYGFKITSDDIKDNITLPRVIEEERSPLTREQLQLIINNQTGLRKAMYLVMSSSGMRVSETLQIRKRDFDFETFSRSMIRLPAKITKTKKPRITFISKEANLALAQHIKRISDDSFVFNPKNRKLDGIRLSELQIFGRLREKLAFTQKYDSGIFKISLGGSMRSWFVTKCNRVDYGFGHALAGHDQYMKRYDRLTTEDKAELYLKSEKLLQVFDYADEDQEKKIDELQQQLQELQDFKKSSEHEIEKLKWINQIKSRYIETGQFPETQKENEKIIKIYKPID
jgi:integrase